MDIRTLKFSVCLEFGFAVATVAARLHMNLDTSVSAMHTDINTDQEFTCQHGYICKSSRMEEENRE